MKESRLRSRSLILRPSPPRSIRKASEKEKVFVKADESSGIGSGLGEMKGGGIKIVPREGSLEIFKLSLSEQETPASPKSRRERMEGRFPPFIARSESMKSHVKAGTLGDIVLEKVAIRIWREWKKLGRRLGVSDEKLQEIDQAHNELSEKGDHMLKYWKQMQGVDATYQALHDALLHPLVDRPDIAEKLRYY